jgi:hypothetical protein
MLGPKNPDASACWCLSHRLASTTNRELVGPPRASTSGCFVLARSRQASWATKTTRSLGGPLSHPERSCPSRGLRRFLTSTSCPSGRCGASACVPTTAAKAFRTPCSTGLWRTRGHTVCRRSRGLHQVRRHELGLRWISPRAHAVELTLNLYQRTNRRLHRCALMPPSAAVIAVGDGSVAGR